MNSLTELNSHSQTEITFTDQRNAEVIFDRNPSNNQVITVSSTSYLDIPNGVEIEEIINYETALCQIKFTILGNPSAPLVGSTLTWPSVPAGVTLTTVGQVYTFTGISKVSQWTALKNPDWTLPANYASKIRWGVAVEISYFDQLTSLRKARTYYVYDPLYFYDALLESSSNLTVEPELLKLVSASLTSSSSIFAVQGPVVLSNGAITSSSSLSCNGQSIIPTLSDSIIIQSSFNSSITGRRAKGLQSIMTTVASIITVPTEFPPMTLRFDLDYGSGEAGTGKVSIPLFGTNNCIIDWGDGAISAHTVSGWASHTYNYANPNTIVEVKVIGSFTRLGYDFTQINNYISEVAAWQNLKYVDDFGYNNNLNSLEGAFAATNPWGLSSLPSTVTNLRGCFYESNLTGGSFTDLVGGWNTVNVTNMSRTFESSTTTMNLSGWNTASVTDMSRMFYDNRNIGFNDSYKAIGVNSWNVSNVTDMSYMFYGNATFNESLTNWNTASLTNMNRMFYGASTFNGSCNTFNVSQVTDMTGLFAYATSFNQPLNLWNTSNVTGWSYIFNNATSFNRDIGMWNVSRVNTLPFPTNIQNFVGMFYGASSFNQNLNRWCVNSISVEPTDWDTGTTAWNKTNRQPIWGTCPS
jgi:surface protein